MKSLYLIITLFIASLTFGQQIKNAKTVEVSIAGNCGMCEKTIEKSGNQAGIAQLDWNRSTKKATLTYDANKTSPKEVLKRVADAGYDNQYYTANDSTYDNLHGCCQYDRIKSPKQEKVACEHKGQKDQACCSGNKNAEKSKSCSTEAKGKSCCSGK